MKILFHFVFTAILVLPAIAQTQADATITPEEKEEKLQQAAVTLLRETYGDVGNLRTLENRIGFTAELASMLWYSDQKAAAAMFGSAVSDFKQLLAYYDGQMNDLVRGEDDPRRYRGRSGPPGLTEPTQLERVERKVRNASGVRQQIALNIAEHEPDLAYNFFYDTLNSITNPVMREMISGMDSYFENRLLEQIARTNAAKATDLAKKRLEKDGLDHQSIAILRSIYEKDAEKGREFAAAMMKRMMAKDSAGESKAMQWSYYFGSLLTFAVETKESSVEKKRKPVLDDGDMRDLAEAIARRFLDLEDAYISDQDVSTIEKLLPGRAVQIRAKKKQIEDRSKAEQGEVTPEMKAAMEANEAALKRAKENSSKAEEEQKEQERLENEFRDGALKLDQKDLPQEERDKILARARDLLSKTPGREKQIMGLSMLAAQVRKAGDQRLASELMREAASLVTTDPRNYHDFMFTWILIAGYAEADPDRAFPLLEDSIMRANEVIASALRVAEFVDVTGELMENGEFLLGAFGGNMIRGLTSEVKIAEAPLRTLSQHDLERLKSIANRVERPEARVLAKILILRATIGKQDADGDVETTPDRK